MKMKENEENPVKKELKYTRIFVAGFTRIDFFGLRYIKYRLKNKKPSMSEYALKLGD